MNKATQKTLFYMALPGLFPRVKALGFSGFGSLAIFMAYVYYMARLLPAGHPYLNPANKGRFGIVHVILEARQNLNMRWSHIDQVILFFVVPAGLLLLIMQLALFVFALITVSAYAGPLDGLSQYFVTPLPEKDIAFMLLDGVFGAQRVLSGGTVPLFGSAVATADLWGPWPSAFHDGLHSMLAFYSYGLFFVAAIIILYYVVTLVGETAITGSPFGERFNTAWAPIRLIVAIFLLIPFGSGLNSGQYLALYMAKWGSSLATNGWINLNSTMLAESTNGLLGDPNKLVGQPTPPDISSLIQFMLVAKTCSHIYQDMYETKIEPYLVKGTANKALIGTDFASALALAENGPISIRFGEYDAGNPDVYDGYDGKVRPYCGDLVLDPKGLSSPGGYVVDQGYYLLLQDMWENLYIEAFAKDLVALRLTPTSLNAGWSGSGWPISDIPKILLNAYYCPSKADDFPSSQCTVQYNTGTLRDANALLWSDFKNKNFPAGQLAATDSPTIQQVIYAGVNRQINGDMTDPANAQGQYWLENVISRGWGGAAIVYNKIAEMNGSLVVASSTPPSITRYPEVMEYISEQHRKSEKGGADIYNPVLANGHAVEFREPGEDIVALSLYYAQTFWTPYLPESTGNVFIDSVGSMFNLSGIPALFGLQGLFAMRANDGVHPLAKLVGVGSALVQNSVTKFGWSIGFGVGSFVVEGKGAAFAQSASSFMVSLAMFGLVIGFILYYVLPFLPFVYFFFAVGNWVKALFETLIGVPLWALAHIRIDGEGLPGAVASNGYFLLLDVLLRPLFILFGFLAGMTVFVAQVTVLDQVWSLVIENVGGFNVGLATTLPPPDADAGAVLEGFEDANILGNLRGALDTLFYMVIYTIIVYMLALSSFKLIDLVPNQIMRWLGVSVSSLAASLENPSGDLISNIYVGANTAMGSVQGAMGAMMLRN